MLVEISVFTWIMMANRQQALANALAHSRTLERTNHA